MGITLDGPDLTVKSEPTVISPRYLVFEDWLGVICTIPATFDLSEVPPELTGLAVAVIEGGVDGHRVWCGEEYRKRPPVGSVSVVDADGGALSIVAEPEAEPEARLSLWERMMGRLNRG
jgi:hypothetical protein